MGNAVVTSDEGPVPAMSFLERFLGVFISPGSAFTDIARKPNFIAPLVVSILASVAVTETMLAKIGMERIIRMSIEQSGRASSMSAEQMQQAVQQGGKVGAIFAHVAGLLGTPIVVLIVAALGILILVPIFGAQANFRTIFSAVCYANLVGIIGAVMALAMILLGDPERFNPQNFIPTNVGFFLNPAETSKSLYSFAASIDILTVWYLILVAMGLSAASDPKLKPAETTAGVGKPGTPSVKARKVNTLPILLCYVGLWVIWILLKMGWSALMG